MTFPTAKEFRHRIQNRDQTHIEESISDALDNWKDPENTTAVIRFQRRDTAILATETLRRKGYRSNANYNNDCRHTTCDDCGYDSDYDNQACIHYRGECDCPKWWNVTITLPSEESDSDSD